MSGIQGSLTFESAPNVIVRGGISQKERHLAAQKRYREAHPDRVKKSKRNWNKQNPDKCKIHRDKYFSAHPDVIREWRKNNPEKALLSSSEWIARNRDKRKAHMIVAHAIEDGKLSKSPCLVCGSVRAHAHHDDYSKPLDITWLCAKHHKEVHANG